MARAAVAAAALLLPSSARGAGEAAPAPAVAAYMRKVESEMQQWRSAARAPVAGQRCFVDPVWSKDQVVVKKDIQFGSAYNNATQTQQALLLDAYFPPDTDTRAQRPVMVLIHGGGFTMGSRSSDGEPDVAYALAQRGFVAVSIEYRLTGSYWGKGPGCHAKALKFMPPCENNIGAVVDSSADGKAAVRFMRKMATEWRLDAGRIGIGGDSAGGITVDFMGYAGSIGEGSSGNPGFSSAVSAVVPISGALRYEYWCSSLSNGEPQGCQTGTAGSGWDHVADITGKGQPALCQVHGTDDLIVPYANAVANKAQADKVGLPNTLITIQGAGHVPIQQLLASQFDELTTCLVGGMDLAGAQCPHAYSR